jgi:LmbE family N-acetylglucosaminyl deacetylase
MDHMLEFVSEKNLKKDSKILLLGAHGDDIEIGCGGTILKLAQTYPDSYFYWVIFSASGTRLKEARKSAKLYLENIPNKKIIAKAFRDGFFPYIGAEIKDFFEQLKIDFDPDIIFTHYRYDLHQDHRLISELTWNTFRSHLILEYEIPKYDGDLGSPNLFVPLSELSCRRKIQILLDSFTSQKDKHWFTQATFEALMRLRGIESGSADTYAEAFYCRKFIWSV